MGCACGKSSSISSKRSSIKHSVSEQNNQSIPQEQQQQEQLDSPALAYLFIMNMRRQQIQQEEQFQKICECEANHHEECLKKCANQRDCYICPRISMPAESSIIRKRQSLVSKHPSDCVTHVSERDRGYS